jgi:eukaryotic-like serine/threonine-protein kinase
MAEVFVATDLRLRRTVALKRLPAAVTPDATAKARMAREARALARVNHPNVVMVFDTVEDDGSPFLVMELVEGDSLRQVLDRRTNLEPAEAVAIASEIASGLAAAHERGIVHRDLKPANILLTASGMVKIGDFGIARSLTDVALTRTGEVFGSPPYVAPEQLTGAPVDARTDLYALGCVLFEMLAGRPPFIGEDPVALTYQHVHTEPVRVDALIPGIPQVLGTLVHGLLAKDPVERPQTADDVRRALVSIPAGVAPHDAPTAPLERTPTTPLPVIPNGRASRTPNRRSWRPWVLGLVLAVAGAMVANALLKEPGLTRASLRRAIESASPSSRPTTSASPAESPSPSSVAPDVATASGAAEALLVLAGQLEAAGELDGHLADDIDHGVDGILRDLEKGDGDKVAEGLDKLRGDVGDALEHEEVSPEAAQQLSDAIDRLATAIGGAGSTGEGGDGDNGD